MPSRAKFHNKPILTNTAWEMCFQLVAFIISTGIEKKKHGVKHIFQEN